MVSQAAAQKNKAPAAGATPVPDANQDQEPPTPATPMTPNNPATNFKAGQGGAAVPPAANVPATAPQAAPTQIAAPQVDQMNFATDMNTSNTMVSFTRMCDRTLADYNQIVHQHPRIQRARFGRCSPRFRL